MANNSIVYNNNNNWTAPITGYVLVEAWGSGGGGGSSNRSNRTGGGGGGGAYASKWCAVIKDTAYAIIVGAVGGRK